MSDVRIIRGYVPGAIGRVTELHAAYYHREWRFGLFFEARVATELVAFLGRYDEGRDGFWTAPGVGAARMRRQEGRTANRAAAQGEGW